jgi:hypothetical protein
MQVTEETQAALFDSAVHTSRPGFDESRLIEKLRSCLHGPSGVLPVQVHTR